MLPIAQPLPLMFLMEPQIVLNAQVTLPYLMSAKENVLNALITTTLTQPPIPVGLISPAQMVSTLIKASKNANVTQAILSLTEQHASLAISPISGT